MMKTNGQLVQTLTRFPSVRLQPLGHLSRGQSAARRCAVGSDLWEAVARVFQSATKSAAINSSFLFYGLANSNRKAKR